MCFTLFLSFFSFQTFKTCTITISIPQIKSFLTDSNTLHLSLSLFDFLNNLLRSPKFKNTESSMDCAAAAAASGCTSKHHNPCFFQPFLDNINSDKLHIPSAFTDAFNGDVPSRISLKNTSGTVWLARLENVDNHLYITTGWDRYVSDHSLTSGEVLVFQYLQNASFLVLVFGADGGIKQEPPKTRTEREGLKGGRRHACTSSDAVNLRFRRIFNQKNFLTMPTWIARTLKLKLPMEIILRFGKKSGIMTELRRTSDRIIIGCFNLADFVELSKACKGDILEFQVIRGDDKKIKEITVKNLSVPEPPEELRRGY